jgi:hypothetical protein
MVELVRSGRNPEELAKEFEPSAQSIRNCEQFLLPLAPLGQLAS